MTSHIAIEIEFDENTDYLTVYLTKISFKWRSAGTEKIQLTPQSIGLAAIAAGFNVTSKDDYENMTKHFPVYDALYAFAKADNKEKFLTSRH